MLNSPQNAAFLILYLFNCIEMVILKEKRYSLLLEFYFDRLILKKLDQNWTRLSVFTVIFELKEHFKKQKNRIFTQLKWIKTVEALKHKKIHFWLPKNWSKMTPLYKNLDPDLRLVSNPKYWDWVLGGEIAFTLFMWNVWDPKKTKLKKVGCKPWSKFLSPRSPNWNLGL